MGQSPPLSDKETEVKLALSSPEAGRELLLRAGFSPLHERAFESNEVFDTPNASLLSSRRLLRLREFRGQTILTFKGPPEPGPHKSRPEFETLASSAPALRQILLGLGYAITFRYEKFRSSFQRPNEHALAVLDETPIGTFLELEGPPAWIDSTAAQLGFSPEDYILLSYSALYREHCLRSSTSPTHMLFTP